MAKILVFEDHPDAQRGIEKILARDGHEVFDEFVDKLSNADLAIAMAVATGVRVAIVDGKLIGGDESDGTKIVKKLREAEIRSIAYATGNSEKMGADIVVGKGTSFEALLNGIAQALDIFIRE